MMLDCGSTVSLMCQEWLQSDKATVIKENGHGKEGRLMTPLGDPLPILA